MLLRICVCLRREVRSGTHARQTQPMDIQDLTKLDDIKQTERNAINFRQQANAREPGKTVDGKTEIILKMTFITHLYFRVSILSIVTEGCC